MPPLAPENENLISQIIHAVRQQNDLLLLNMDLVTEHRAKIINASFEKAMAYSNVIITLGYAALFTILNYTKENIGHRAFIVTCVLIGISILFYVGFTIYSMIYNIREIKYQIPLTQINEVEKFQVEEVIYQIRCAHRLKAHVKVWQITFIISVVTGIAAALIIIGWNIYNLF